MKLLGHIPGRQGIWEVGVVGNHIHVIRQADRESADEDNGDFPWLAAGFFDMQVNGYAGIAYNQEELSGEQVEATVQAIWSTGTALMFPTIGTDTPERMCRICRTLRYTMDHSSSVVKASLAGIHMEGPYISAEDGPRGAHDLEAVRPPSWDEFTRLQDIAGGAIRLITLAPELPGALEFITRAVEQGCVVAIGHTSANPQEIAAAISAGATFSTHLGNGAHAMLRRHPNYIWEQLAADELWAGLIPDGFHLPPSVLKVMIRAKGSHRCILTADVAGIAGMPPGIYTSMKNTVELLPGGPVLLSGTPFLAGSALRLSDGVANVTRLAGIGLAEAVEMVTWNPAQLFGLTQRTGHLHAGMEANITVFRLSANGNMHVDKTIVQGQIVYSAGSDD